MVTSCDKNESGKRIPFKVLATFCDIATARSAGIETVVLFEGKRWDIKLYLVRTMYNGDRLISNAEAEAVISLDVGGDWTNPGTISDLTGIEAFVNIGSLDCSENPLTGLDVSNNTALTHLNCFANQLTSLDVSNNTALTNLRCLDNQLIRMDVSNNIALTALICAANQLTSLDVSNNTALEHLRCGRNNLTSLDVSNNTALINLECWDNQLTSLDVSYNTALVSG